MAANIVSATYTAAGQVDGSAQVHEVHTDLIGLTWTHDYLAPPGADLQANMEAWETILGQQLADQEIATNVAQVLAQGAGAAFTFNYSIIQQTVAAGLEAFPTATPAQAIMLGDWLQAQSAEALELWFGLTADQVTSVQALPSLASQIEALNALVAQVSA